MKYLTALLYMALATMVHASDLVPASNTKKAGDAFLNPEVLIITPLITSEEWRDDSQRLKGRVIKKTTVKFYLKNTTPHLFNGLRVEYCVYRNRHDSGRESQAIDHEKKDIGTLTPLTDQTVWAGTQMNYKIDSRNFLNEVVAIRARIYLPVEEGEEVMREVLFPASMRQTDYKWDYPEEDADSKPTQSPHTSLSPDKKRELKKAAACHTFTTTTGTKITARLLDFIASTGRVKMETNSGTKRIVRIETLSENDHAYIQDWYSAYSLLKTGKLKIKIDEETNDEQLYHGLLEQWDPMFPNMGYKTPWYTTYPGTTYDDVSYNLTVENKTGQPLDNSIIEYCIYHQTVIDEESEETRFNKAAGGMSGWYPAGHVDNYPEQTVSHIMHGSFGLKTLPNREEKTKTTKSLKLVPRATEIKSTPLSPAPHETGNKGTRNTREIEGELLGIRCRIYIPTPQGNMAMMEFSDPKNLLRKTEWPDE